MDRSDISELLSAYLDGEATPAERAEVERQLESSPRWRAELEQLGRLSEMIRGLPREAAPPELAAAVQRQMAQAAKLQPVAMQRSYRREWLAALAGMAVTVAVMLIGIQALEHRRSTNAFMAEAPARDFRISEAAKPESRTAAVETAPTSFALSSPAKPDRLSEHLGQVMRSPAPGASPSAAPDWSDDAVLSDMIRPDEGASLDLSANGRDVSEEEELARKPGWDQVRIGDVLKVFERTSDVVAVVELVVVDINEGGGQLEMALSRSGLKVLSSVDGLAVDAQEAKDTHINGALKYDAPQDAPELSGQSPLRMLYVTAPRATISQVLDELGRQRVISQARMQPPVDAPVAIATELLAEDDKNGNQSSSVENAEQAAVDEAFVVSQNFVSQNFRQTPRFAAGTKASPSEPAVEDRSIRTDEESLVGKSDLSKKQQSRSRQAAKSIRANIAMTTAAPKAAQPDAAIANSAVPMTVNPQTGEVRSYLQRLPAKESKTSGNQESQQFFDAPADANLPATAEQNPEPTIRVLFVVKRAATP